MSVRNLAKIFKPQRIAVIGASNNPQSAGYTVLKNLIGAGFQGVVYPVNPKHEAVQGIQAYPNVASLPKTPDLAVICTPARTVPGIVRECGEAGIRGLVIISAGFKEAGEQGKALEQEIRRIARAFEAMRIVGPNCLGIIVPGLKLNASFAGAMPKAGHVAFISQSGALCTSVLDWALEEEIGFSYFVSTGNMLDVDFGDLIDYDREMAIVAIVEEDGQQKLAGVGRLVADPDREVAEYAVFVADPWQNRGLGGVLTGFCLEIAQNWGIREVRAETTPDNFRMISIFQHRGFSIEHRHEEGVVLATWGLTPSR